MCSLDGLTAWKCPEPTKWAVVVKDGARATTRENEVFSAKIAKLIWPLEPVRHFDYDGPFRRRGTLPGCHLKTSSREHTLFAPDDRPDIMLGPTVRGVGVNNCTRIHTYRSPYCVTVRSLNREGGGSDRHFRTNEYESTALTLPDRTSLRPNSEHPRSRSGCKVWTRVLYTRPPEYHAHGTGDPPGSTESGAARARAYTPGMHAHASNAHMASSMRRMPNRSKSWAQGQGVSNGEHRRIRSACRRRGQGVQGMCKGCARSGRAHLLQVAGVGRGGAFAFQHRDDDPPPPGFDAWPHLAVG